ncbi:MAG TPA: FMN-binding protein [Gemmatimonadales bacterium]|nr:FMN-binding protein [Gemmatimonadales bacterium]
MLIGTSGLHAQAVRLTQDEALRLAFPAPAVIERRTAFLTHAQLAAARSLAGRDVPIEQRVITYYTAARDGEALGAAYFDAHRVRSLTEVLMVVVGPEGRIRRVEILRFDEPPEYRAPAGWLNQFPGDSLEDRLSLKGDVATMAGATLTSHAVVRAVRRVLALHAAIRPGGVP